MSTTRQPPRRTVTRQLSGHAKSRYLRQLAEDAGAGPQAGAKLDADIVQVLVRGTATPGPAKGSRRGLGKTAEPRATAVLEPVGAREHSAVANPLPATAASVQVSRPGKAAAKQNKAKATPPQPPFNPYGFSAMAVLLNEGRPALEAILGEVTTREQFVKLVEAQSVRIDPALLAGKSANLDALRAAFIDAVALRIAHRRAISAS